MGSISQRRKVIVKLQYLFLVKLAVRAVLFSFMIDA